MTFLRTSIKRRIMAAMMLTSVTVLLLTSAALYAYEWFAFRQQITQYIQLLARMTALTSSAPLAFLHEEEASEALKALEQEPHILVAAVYDREGSIHATYQRDAATPKPIPDLPAFEAVYFVPDGIVAVQPVFHKDGRVGTVYLKSDLLALRDRFQLYGVLFASVTAGAILLALALSSVMQRRITRPILALSQTARTVSEEKDYSVRAQKLTEDELGLLTDAFNLMLTQIQERTQALNESGERLRMALRASQTGTWTWDLSDDKLTWDEFTSALFGLPPGRAPRNLDQMLELVHPDDRHLVRQVTAHAVQHGTDLYSVFRVVLPEGQVRFLAARGRSSPPESGGHQRMAGVCMDITERKQAEDEIRTLNAQLEQRVQQRTAELQSINRELEAFTYSVSHDLRAPLRHIDGYAQILEQDFAAALEPGAQILLKRIRKGTVHMGRLVDDLLNLARVGRSDLNLQQVPLQPLVEEVIHSLQPEIAGRNVQWKVQPLPLVLADPGLIQQVFANLLSNSVKYTRPRSEAVIEIGCTLHEGVPVFLVRDNGVGFSMAHAGKLFGVFQRLHRVEDFEGTGVGLATVQRIVQKHGGRIWAEAERDRGAAFYFSLSGLKGEGGQA